MIAVVGGLIAALCWAASSLCARRSSRIVGPQAAVAWVMLFGLVPVTPLALGSGTPAGLDAGSATWAYVGGLGAIVGLVAMYAALREGKVSVVAPITAAEGAIAATIAIAFGERLGLAAGLMLVVIVAGIVLTSLSPDVDGPSRTSTGATFAIVAAVCFGASLYGLGRAGDDLGALWTLFIIRLIALAALIVPLLVLRRLRFHRSALPFLLGSGVLELAGGAAFIRGTDDGIAVASVVASKNAAFVVAAGYVFLGERLGRVQAIGVGTVLGGVTLLAGLQGVIAILVGLLAAGVWGIAGLVNGRASRLVGAPLAVAWALLTGAAIIGVLAAASGWPGDAEPADWLWGFAAGAGTIGGLLLSYESYRRGKLGVVAPIVATQGAIAAVLAVATGDPLSLASGFALAVIVVGVVVAAGGEPAEEGAPPRRRQRAAYVAPLVAAAGAVSFGFGLFSASQVGDDLNPLWVAFIPGVLGLAVVVVPVALRSGGLRLPRPVWPLAAVGSALEVSGLVAFVIAARDDAAIAAVMSSQFAIVTAIGGYLLWDERIGRIQVAGVALVLAGVAGLTLLQA